MRCEVERVGVKLTSAFRSRQPLVVTAQRADTLRTPLAHKEPQCELLELGTYHCQIANPLRLENLGTPKIWLRGVVCDAPDLFCSAGFLVVEISMETCFSSSPPFLTIPKTEAHPKRRPVGYGTQNLQNPPTPSPKGRRTGTLATRSSS